MRVIVACECSGAVRDAFIARGHDAISCDLKPTETPGPHYQGDIFTFLKNQKVCDLLIAHPPCTYLTKLSAPLIAHDPSRIEKMQEAARFFYALWSFENAKYICVENPYPLARACLPHWTQVIQPYYFGHPYIKATCLWLRGLPPLQPTDPKPETRMETEPRKVRPSGRKYKHPNSWVSLMDNRHKTRAADRARTFSGIANAMADQWGNLTRPYGFFS